MMTKASLIGLTACAALACASAEAGALERQPESARSCPRHGPGFIEVPGTSTCIRIGGRVRAEYGSATGRVSRDRVDFGRTGQVSLDSRTDTAYGPFRSFVRIRAGHDTRP